MIVYFFVCSLLIFNLSLAEIYDTRRPRSTKLRYNFRVKDDSIFRKMIPFEDKRYYPCNYFKIIPFYLCLMIAIISLLLLLIDLMTTGFVSAMIPEDVFILLTLFYLISYFVYWVVIYTWWEIVDHREMKFTKEEKEELKRLRKIRKEIDSKNKK